jgi:hypothetical protein
MMMYNNMIKDGTWKHEIDKNNQIIVSTKASELQAKLENQVKQVVALATQAKKKIAPDPANEGSTCCSKRDPYTVTA